MEAVDAANKERSVPTNMTTNGKARYVRNGGRIAVR